MNKENIQRAVKAIRGGGPSDILEAVAALTDTERLVVQLVLELTTPAGKTRRSDAGTRRTRAAATGSSEQ